MDPEYYFILLRRKRVFKIHSIFKISNQLFQGSNDSINQLFSPEQKLPCDFNGDTTSICFKLVEELSGQYFYWE